jgi:3-isopropylmalate/(R)-2-methylmalate dehydratase small subunit
MRTFEGRVFVLGDNVNTDIIVPPKFVGEEDPKVMASHAFEALRPELPTLLHEGGILSCGHNFGCGSSREQATEVLRQLGVKCVIAKSFARIFFRNAINNGLLVIQDTAIPGAVREGDLLQVDPGQGRVHLPGGVTKQFTKLPPSLMAMVGEGGLVPYWQKVNAHA